MTAAVWRSFRLVLATGYPCIPGKRIVSPLKQTTYASLRRHVRLSKFSATKRDRNRAYLGESRKRRARAMYTAVWTASGVVTIPKESSLSTPRSEVMSVFGDFQRVWVQRFPDSALPAAWEEDVRANLVKHKQKVIDQNWNIHSNLSDYYSRGIRVNLLEKWFPLKLLMSHWPCFSDVLQYEVSSILIEMTY